MFIADAEQGIKAKKGVELEVPFDLLYIVDLDLKQKA